MASIKPISDLRNNFNAISTLCHQHDEPVFITKNGEQDLVVMSHALYEQQQAILSLYRQLEEAAEESRVGKGVQSHKKLMESLTEGSA